MDKNIKLQKVKKEDLRKILKWKNDKELSKLIMSQYKENSLEEVKKWYEKTSKDKSQILLGIYIGDLLIGIIRAMFINWNLKTAELGIYIGDEEKRGRGYGSVSLGGFIKYLFQQYQLNELYLRVAEDNIPAIKSYYKLGFRKNEEIIDNVRLMKLKNIENND